MSNKVIIKNKTWAELPVQLLDDNGRMHTRLIPSRGAIETTENKITRLLRVKAHRGEVLLLVLPKQAQSKSVKEDTEDILEIDSIEDSIESEKEE